MAFWGVEVKPGKPYSHNYHSSHGRLRISQATLGSCDAVKRSVVQCVVGNKAPIVICSLNPRLAEMCHLEIELEEDGEVLFSVLGPSSVHLSGYYLRPSSRSGAGDDESESYGEDVGESDTDRDYDVSEDSYESDFIDDGGVEVPEKNDVSDSMDDGDVCSTPDRHKPASEEHAGKVKRQRRLKKKYQVDSTEDKVEDSSCKRTVRRNRRSIFDSGSEDEDFLAKEEDLPSLAKKTNGKVSNEIKPENVESNEETKKESRNVRKRKSDTINQDPASPMDVTEVNESSVPKQEAESKKKSKKKKKTPLEAEDGKHSNNIRTLENGLVIEDLSTGNEDAEVASNGSKVYISYVGRLQDGKTVHSNAREKPYKFKLGAKKVIPGWNLGIDGMHVGDKRRLTIPPSLCENGGKPVGEAPKNSTVIYEVELVKVR